MVYDEITEDEIEEIWTRESPDDEEPVRLNGNKSVRRQNVCATS